MPPLRRLGLLALFALAALVVPGLALAAPDTVITFEDRPVSATENIDDEYLGIGVEFGHPHLWGIDVGIEEGCGRSGDGAQHIVSDGINGRGLDNWCTGRPPTGEDSTADRGVSFGWRYTVERPRVSFNLRATANPTFDGFGTQPGPFAVRVRYLGVANNLLAQQDFSIAKGGTVSPSLNHGVTSDIAYVVITAPLGRVIVDDIVAGLDDVPPPPKFTIALLTPTIDLTEGDTGVGQVKAVRFNGSTGTVPLSLVGGLPAGIVAAAAAGPLAGTGAVAFNVTAASPAAGERQLQLTSANGAPGTFVGSPVLLTVRLQSALYGDRTTLGATPGCGTVNANILAGVRGNYNGAVTMTLTKLGGPATVTVVSSVANAVGNGTISFPLTLSSPATESPSTYDVTLTPANATPISFALAVYAGAAEQVRISALENTYLYRPPGSGAKTFQAIVRGNFPSSCPLTFRDDLGNTLTRVAGSVSREAGQDEGIRLDLGADPTTTKIHAFNAANVELATSPLLTVADYRNTFGSTQTNGGGGARIGDLTWADFDRAFGKDDTESCFDAYCWRNGTALGYFKSMEQQVEANPGPGLCYGWAAQSISFFTQTELVKQFDAKAGNAFAINNWTDSSAIKHNIATWHIRQFDKASQLSVQAQAANPDTPAGLRAKIDDAIQRNQPPIISIWQNPYGTRGNSGHAVVAIDTRSTADGGYDILTHNPNTPFALGELSNATVRTARLQANIIHVTPAGVWSGGITGWTGGMGQIQIEPLPPLNASLPIDVPVVQAGWRVSQIVSLEVGGEEALRPDGSVLPGKGVLDASIPTGGEPMPLYQLQTTEPVTMTIAGKADAPYTASLLGGSVNASVEGARTEPGQRDTLAVQPNAATVEFASDASSTPVTLGLDLRLGTDGRAPSATDPSKPTRSARVTLRAGGDRSDRLSVGATVALAHEGSPTTASVTLVQTGGGLPQSVTYAPIALAADQSLSLKPDSWKNLAAGASFTVRNAGGAVVRSGRATRLAPKTIKLGPSVSVTTKALKSGRGIVTVKGRVLKRGGAPLLIVRATVVRGGKAIATAYGTRRGTGKVKNGRFSIPVNLKALPAGARVQVSVTLIDEAASLASLTRTATTTVR